MLGVSIDFVGDRFTSGGAPVMRPRVQIGTKTFDLTALVDTGAGRTLIHQSFVEGQVPVEFGIPISGAYGGDGTAMGYKAFLTFPGCSIRTETRAVGLDLSSRLEHYQMLIGRDFLCTGRLVIDNRGESVFVFHTEN